MGQRPAAFGFGERLVGEFFLAFELEEEIIDLGIGFELGFAACLGGLCVGLRFQLLVFGLGFIGGVLGGSGDGWCLFNRLRFGDEVGELPLLRCLERVLDGLPVGFDLFLGWLDLFLDRIHVDADDVGADALAVDGVFLGDGVCVRGEAGSEDPGEGALGDDIGGEFADITFSEAEAAYAFLNEIPVCLLRERAVRAGEGTELADEGVDLRLTRIDSELLFRGAEDHPVGEEIFQGLVASKFRIAAKREEEHVELEIPRLPERLGELVGGWAEVFELLVRVGAPIDLDIRGSASGVPHGAGVHEKESDQDEDEEDDDESGVFAKVFDHGAVAGAES